MNKDMRRPKRAVTEKDPYIYRDQEMMRVELDDNLDENESENKKDDE